jgi:flagellar motor switch protein FliG
LKGASQELVDAVLAGMSSRAGDLLRDELELLAKVKKSEVESARREMVETALKLEAEGRVDLGRGGE